MVVGQTDKPNNYASVKKNYRANGCKILPCVPKPLAAMCCWGGGGGLESATSPGSPLLALNSNEQHSKE